VTDGEFQRVLECRLESARAVLAAKAREYAGPIDRLHNFKASAALLRCTPEVACLSFLTKHLTSIIDMVYEADRVHPAEKIDEKIGDAINYLILLEALMRERSAPTP
jgi:hypothetical protein